MDAFPYDLPTDAPPDEGGRRPYDRLPNESPQAWAAFVAYRDLPPGDRSIAQAVGDAPSKRRQYERYSARYDWVVRAQAWDEEVDRTVRHAALAKQAEIATEASAKLLAALRAVTPEAIAQQPASIPRWIHAVSQAARLVAGEPTAIISEVQRAQIREAQTFERFMNDLQSQVQANAVQAGILPAPPTVDEAKQQAGEAQQGHAIAGKRTNLSWSTGWGA